MCGLLPHAYRYEEGRLLAELRGGVFAIVGWPAPRAEWRPNRGKAEAGRPDFRLVYPTGQEPGAALAEFRATLPAGVARILEPFASHQWNLLELLAARPEGLQLASHNPSLAYLLANNDHFRKNLTKAPAYLAEWRLDYTQERLLEWLGFPGQPAVVKLFRRIEPSALGLAMARLLRVALKCDPSVLPLLAHQRRINRGVLSLVVMPQCRPLLTPTLLQEVAARPDGSLVDDPGERLLGLLAKIAELDLPARPGPVRSLRQLDRLAEQVEAGVEAHRIRQEALRAQHAARLLQREADRLREQDERQNADNSRQDDAVMRFANSIPPPPDTGDIIRLRTRADAEQEGRAQHNCVADSAKRIAANREFVYRVLKPQRATLELGIGKKGIWFVKQLKLARNREVSPLTRSYVEGWLNAYQATILHRRAEAAAIKRASPFEDEVPF